MPVNFPEPIKSSGLIAIFFRLIGAEIFRIIRTPQDLLPAIIYFTFSVCMFSLLNRGNSGEKTAFVAALFLFFFSAGLPAAERIFIKDLRTGRTDLYLYAPVGLAGVFCAKIAALWLAVCAPILLLIACCEKLFSVGEPLILPITSGLCVASFGTIFLAGLGAIVSGTLGRGGALGFILTLPLAAPGLLFSAGAALSENMPEFTEALRFAFGFGLFSALSVTVSARYLLKKLIEES
jgi:heme exporter protein B